MRIDGEQGARCRECPTRGYCLTNEVLETQLPIVESVFLMSAPLTRGDHLYHAGELADSHFHMRSGVAKTYSINSAGDEFVTGFYLPGEMVGCAQQDGLHTDSAIALETTTVCQLRDEDIGKLTRLGIEANLFKRLSEREYRAAQRQFNLVQDSAEARVAGFFMDLSDRLARLDRYPAVIPLSMSRTDIANYIGLTLATLSRVFAKMTKAGVISASRHEVHILQPADLEVIGLHAVS